MAAADAGPTTPSTILNHIHLTCLHTINSTPPSYSLPFPLPPLQHNNNSKLDSLPPSLLLEIEHMEWYLREDTDGFVVEGCNDEYMEDVLPTRYDWCQGRATESKFTASPNNYRSASATPAENPMCGDEVPSGSGAREEPSSCGQAVFKLENGTEMMDDIFLDSFLEEDQLCPDYVYTTLSFEDLLSNMLADDSSGRESETCADACSFPMSDSPSCLTSYESERFISNNAENKVTASVPRITSAIDNSELVRNLDEVKCSEAMVLLELEDVMLQMSEKTRICFRDAMYRLAKCCEQKRSTYQIGSENATQVHSENSRMESSRYAEAATNIIDRTVANLMFSEQQYSGLPDFRIP